jgi:hypothetical protein
MWPVKAETRDRRALSSPNSIAPLCRCGIRSLSSSISLSVNGPRFSPRTTAISQN